MAWQVLSGVKAMSIFNFPQKTHTWCCIKVQKQLSALTAHLNIPQKHICGAASKCKNNCVHSQLILLFFKNTYVVLHQSAKTIECSHSLSYLQP